MSDGNEVLLADAIRRNETGEEEWIVMFDSDCEGF